MCVTCGCGATDEPKLSLHSDPARPAGTGAHWHLHGQDHVHPAKHEPEYRPHRRVHRHDDASTEHSHDPAVGLAVAGQSTHTLELEARILGKNQLVAERNRGWLAGRSILALNLVSSPGAGKTTLLERTLSDLKDEFPIAVVEGDQATSNDAERIHATGVPAVQVNTGTGCHLEADMLERALKLLRPPPNSLLLIENVGNLVCPALFDLGEQAKVVIFSVTEGEDKPLKYPHMFRAARVVILSKMDLAPHVRFDVARAMENARSVNPGIRVFRLSAYSGEGLGDWYAWLKEQRRVGT